MDTAKTAMDSVTTLVALASNYGPFLFSIVLLLYVTRWAQKSYDACATRKDPPAEASQLSLYRWNFIGTLIATVLLIICSIAWWFFSQTRINAYQFKVTELSEQQHIWSDADDFYTHEVSRNVPGAKVFDIYFAVVRYGPLQPGDVLLLRYAETPPGADVQGPTQAPQGRQTYKVQVVYDGKNNKGYTLDWDSQGKPILSAAN
jgi:hypothetical protein